MKIVDILSEDTFNQYFQQIDNTIRSNADSIRGWLTQMFPKAAQAIDDQYNDEDGMPFAEWRRIIFEIDQWQLSGPVVVDSKNLPISQDDYNIRLKKYQDYVADKDAGKPARYFRQNDSDPRNLDFTKLPPIVLANLSGNIQIVDGMHRATIAKIVGKPLRAYVWKKVTNQHPNVAKIKALFDPLISENFADGKVKGKSRPGRVKRAGASCKGSVTDLRAKAKKYGGEKGKMYHWCANMKGGKQ